MTTYRKITLADVKDSAPEFGMDAMGEARFARKDLGAENIGLTRYKMNPAQRLGFGHRHGESEEVYVVVSGSGRFKVGDEEFPVAALDAVFCPADAMREWESGPDGMELLAIGAHAEGESSDMDREFWPSA
jgi:mannose-6-phosphate isomerase-like protein (cupin superfamily)